MIKVLVVEDDRDLNQIVTSCLNVNNYIAKRCLHVNEAYESLNSEHFDIIISDIMMPDIDGFEFAKTVRSLNNQIPILFMTARDDISAKQKGYGAGIDDYMVKPIDLEELLLRIEALVRRANIESTKMLKIGSFSMDANAMEITFNGNNIPVTLREFNILYKLLTNPQHAFSRAQLMDEFWDMGSNTSLRAVDVYITKLRDKLSEVSDFRIVTVHGLGYKVVLNDK